MASLANIPNDFKVAVETAAADLVHVSNWGDAAYINLPIFMPSGSAATVRITQIADQFHVDDGGFAYREMESVGSERSFPKIAAKYAALEGLQTDRRTIFTDAPKEQLVRAISDVAMASHLAVSDVYGRLSDQDEGDIEDYLRARLESIFDGARIEPDQEISGASSHPWKVSAALHLDSGLIVFQAVGNHPYSVYKASTAFHDLNELPTPPVCVAVVKDKAAMGANLNVLAQAGRVIQGDQPDDTYKLAATA